VKRVESNVEQFDRLIALLPKRHQVALRWFAERAGDEHSWPQPIEMEGIDEATHLASKAKGIYKPKWSRYALSVRQSLRGPYPDRKPIVREDGTWIYGYFQENENPDARDLAFTNRGLIACWRDSVPVGVMRQVNGKPNIRYKILGIALVVGWESGWFFLEGFSRNGLSHGRGPAGRLEVLRNEQERLKVLNGSFEPRDLEDARERIIASIVLRRGQPAFRTKLLETFKGKCPISDCDVPDALEAVHILPFRGPETNHPGNGMILRADLHTLFDLGLIAIDPRSSVIRISGKLVATSYGSLDCRQIALPEDRAASIRAKALEQHLLWSGLDPDIAGPE